MFLKNLENIPLYVSGTKGNGDYIRLSSNENNYGPSPKVMKVIRKISKFSFKYPNSSYQELKEIIAKENNVKPKNIILGNGSDEIFLYLFLIYLSTENSIITIEKTFTYYKILAYTVGAKVMESKREANFSISCKNILNLISPNTKIIIFPSPDNPTGVITSRECIETILKNISKDTLFILDEAYFQFVPKEKYWNSIELIEKYPNFIVTRTFSKLYALAGLRIGYGICSQEISEVYEKIRMPFNISLIAVEGAKQALLDKEYYQKTLTKILKDREILKKELEKLDFEVLKESYGNFIFCKGPYGIDNKLFERKITVRNLESFGYEKNFYRITVGTTKENKIFLKTLKEIIKGEKND
ncbi:MAG: histidinol-phosphate transaminase [Brevinematia bacterium]